MNTRVGLSGFNGQLAVANPSDPDILLSIYSSVRCGHAKTGLFPAGRFFGITLLKITDAKLTNKTGSVKP
jgi:hypothetical protein